ncbi:MAG: glycosyltransferase family 4 protein [Bacteroidota bacterium]
MKPPKKIAFVANSSWNIYNFRLNLIRALINKGLEVIVIAPVDEYIHYLNKVPGITHIPLRRLSRNSTNPFRDLILFTELRRIYRQQSPDLIVHYTVKPNIFGNLAARSCGIPSVCVVTGLGYTFLRQGIVKHITLGLYKFSFQFADRVVFENPDDQQLFVSENIAAPEQCTTVNGCGVDTQFYQCRKKSKFKSNIVFTFIGRLLYDKGIVEYVQAAEQVKKRVPNAIFWVIGEIDEGNPSFISKPQLLRWIEDQTIRYFGTTKDVRSFIQQSDCVVLPSYREGLPKVILEAMSMGKPIVTTDTAGCRQTVDQSQNGFIVPVENAKALSLALETFCGLSQKEKEEMGQKSRDKAVRMFDGAIVVKQYFDLIKQIIGNDSIPAQNPKSASRRSST